LTNTIPINSFTSTEVNGAAAAASAGLTIVSATGGMTMTKTATPTSVGINTAIRVTLSFTSAGGALTAGTFTDTLPQTAQPMIALTDAGHAPTFSNCGSSSPTVTFGGTGGNTVVSGSNLATTANGTCAVSFSVEFTTPTGPSRMDVNTVTSSGVTFTSSGGPVSPLPASVTLTQVPTISVNNYTASALTLANQQVSVLATIYDSSGTADTNAVLVVNLNAGKVQLAATPNFTFTGCPAGLSASNITVTTNREQFTVAVGSISATCAIGYDVIDEAGALGSYTPGNPTYSSTLTGGVAISSTALNSVTFSTTTINVTKAFNPNQIQSGGNATADITLTVAQAGALSRTQANGVAFSDALPTGVTFSPTPNVNFTAGCQQIGQPAPGYTIAGTTISFTNISLLTLNSTPTTCDAKFDVTSTVVGAPLNQINAGAITSTSGTTNTQVAKASLTVNSGLGIAKTFVNPSFIIGTTDYTRFLVTNSASTSQLTGGTLVDAMPSTLTLASTTLGSIQAGDPALCGGSVAGPVGTSTLNLSGLTVAGSTGVSTPGQCVVYVQIQASSSAAPGLVTNTIAAGGLNIGGSTNETAATGTVTLAAPSNDSITKTFTPNTIAPNVTSVLSILIDNSVAGTANLNGMALTDTLPTGLKVATTPTASTTCGAGTVTATAGTTNVVLANGSVAAGATCTITVNVTGPTGGSFTNTIAANALTTVQGATNPTAATANLTIASVALSKAFAPAAITAGGSSTLTITIPNGAIALTGLRLSDTLPSGVTIAASPNATTTCGAGTVSATAGGSVVALTGGSLAANASCTIVASVTGTVAATYTNTIPTNAIVTTQGITNT
ncbi:MAG: hypothetical protein IAI50_21100, partial [Candidatus Eremiobacteraeota bacterium]|nr:hypothetical protein [Candidatus Eremiobacteraeota bacterium]